MKTYNHKTTYDEFVDLLEHGNDFEVEYKGILYFIENDNYGYSIFSDEVGDQCNFDEKEEFYQKAHIQGDLLKDIYYQLTFTSYTSGDFE